MEKSGLEQITQDFISAIPSSHFSCPSYSASSWISLCSVRFKLFSVP